MPFQQKLLQLQNGQSINYIEFNPEGQQAIIFVHGNFSSWLWWKDLFELLQQNKKYHVFAIDQRGFGKSSYKQPVTRFAQHAQDLKNFIQLKGLKNVVLIGWSYGGGICMKTAEIAPQLIYKIIPTCSVSHLGLPFFNEQNQQVFTREDILAIPRFAFAQNVRKTRNQQTQRSIFDAVLFTKVPNYPEQKKRQLIESSFIQAQYLDVLVALANPDIDISKIKAKTLMIHGKQDIVIKLDSVLQTGVILGNSLQVWQNHAHMIPIQDPKRYFDRITKFIDQQ